MTSNYFVGKSSAQRYAKSRPYFHPIIARKIKERLSLREQVPMALDVACGTGQSTLALTEVASIVIGTDISPSMLGAAIRHPAVRYVNAAAEQLPFAAATFDLLTVGLAFHWFDQALFMHQANRVLKAGGWLVVYNNYFVGKMDQNPAFEYWVRSDYLARFPTPRRYKGVLADDEVRATGFGQVQHDEYSNRVDFSPEQLASYLMTQTNVIATTERGAERLDENEVYSWLLSALRPLFPEELGTFQFAGTIDFVQKEENNK